jgi:tellurite resistance protein
MDEAINSIAEYRLIPEHLEKISQEGKVWLARAIVNILIADKQLVPEEKGFFKDVIMMIEKDEILYELIESIKKRESVELGALTTDREYAGQFFFLLGMVVAADGKVKNSEVNMLTSIGGKLGFPAETAKQVLHWVTEIIRLNNDRNQIIKLLKDIKPVFILK